MQLLFLACTVSALALLKRGHELAAAAIALVALLAMLVSFGGTPLSGF